MLDNQADEQGDEAAELQSLEQNLRSPSSDGRMLGTG